MTEKLSESEELHAKGRYTFPFPVSNLGPKGRTQIEGAWGQGAEGNISTYEVESNGRLKKTT
jgi:hypothetical protein